MEKNIYIISDTEITRYDPNLLQDKLVSKLIKEELGFNDGASAPSNIQRILTVLGFEWDPLSDAGYMRYKPDAAFMMSQTRNFVWELVRKFCRQSEIPVQRIEGGDLYNINNEKINKHLKLAKEAEMYGDEMYVLQTGGIKQVLRFSGCSNKLSMLEPLNNNIDRFPFAIFEISTSYRYEKSEKLNLCERVRCFHLPETHIISKQLTDSIEIAKKAHRYIIKNLQSYNFEYLLYCSTTYEFFESSKDFFLSLSKEERYPIIVVVNSDEDLICENGIQFDIEYKAITSDDNFIEIATIQVDDGDTDFSYGLKSNTGEPLSTVHAVFFASIERAIYALIDRVVKNEEWLPYWLMPVHCRIILKENCAGIEYSNNIVAVLERNYIRYDIDDRDISFKEKLQDELLKLIPFICIIDKKGEMMYVDKVYSKSVVDKSVFIKSISNLTNEKFCDSFNFNTILLSQRTV